MAEHKVEKILEKEALDLSEQKPDEERLIKADWFRKEEDKDQREIDS